MAQLYRLTQSGLSVPSRSRSAAEDVLATLPWANTPARQAASLAADQYRSTPALNYLRALPGEDPVDWAARRKVAVGFVNFYLKARCLLYVFDRGPTRTVEFDQETADRRAFWDALTGESVPLDPDDETTKYNALWRRLQMEVLYHGVCLLKSHYRSDEGQAPLPIIFRPWQFDVVLDPRDRRRFTAVKVLLNASEEEIAMGALQGYGHLYEVWVGDQFYIVDDDWKIHQEIRSPYFRLPFMRVASDPLWMSFFPPAYHEDLVPACKAFADLDTEELDLGYNLFGQPVVKGEAEEKDKKRYIGKNVPQYCEAGGDYSRASPNSDVAGFLAIQKDLRVKFGMAQGISPAIVDWASYEARDPSSLALRAAQYGPLESRDEDAEQWTRYELRAAALHAGVQGAHENKEASYYLPRRYRIDFPTVAGSTVTEAERIAGQDMEIRNELSPRWRVLQSRYPELTDSEAQARVAEARAERLTAQIKQGATNG